VVQGLAELGSVAESQTVDLATGVDRCAVLLRAALAGGVEILERQSDRIHQLVTAGAGGVSRVDRKPVPRRLAGRIGIVEQLEVHVPWRRGNLLAQENLAHRLAAQGGRTLSRMGMQR